MRKLTEHQVNPANDKLTISVMDKPGAGGASHLYMIEGFNQANNQATVEEGAEWSDPERPFATVDYDRLCIVFQNGPINEAGVNGVTNEALLAVVIDRMRSFQAGQYACRENAIALTKLEEAQMWLLQRTRNRMARGVEGTHEK